MPKIANGASSLCCLINFFSLSLSKNQSIDFQIAPSNWIEKVRLNRKCQKKRIFRLEWALESIKWVSWGPSKSRFMIESITKSQYRPHSKRKFLTRSTILWKLFHLLKMCTHTKKNCNPHTTWYQCRCRKYHQAQIKQKRKRIRKKIRGMHENELWVRSRSRCI